MGGKLTYQQAGVDTKRAAALVGDIRGQVARTQGRRRLWGAFGLFAACYDLSGYREPVIVTGCDGVGTKLELLLERDLLEFAGRDLVAMSVNDILTTGADPLMFLDYIGLPALDEARVTRLVTGMADHLEACGCILAGGETAEMPGIVPEGIVELSGFCVGAAEKSDLIDPGEIREGDRLIGWASDSIHANGWSLVRRVLRERPGLVGDQVLESWLRPTRLYHDVVEGLRDAEVRPRALAHITGGGLPENLERLFRGLGAELEIPPWRLEGIEALLEEVDADDRFHTFNMGVGWVAIVAPERVGEALKAGPGGFEIGEVVAEEGVRVRVAAS